MGKGDIHMVCMNQKVMINFWIQDKLGRTEVTRKFSWENNIVFNSWHAYTQICAQFAPSFFNTRFELFICHLNKLKPFRRKQLCYGVWALRIWLSNIHFMFSIFLDILFSTKPQTDGNNKCLFSDSWFQIIILSPTYFIFSSSSFKFSLVAFLFL